MCRWAVDPIRGFRVISASKRKGRPHEGRDEGFVCPFCPGNEGLTPPEVLRVGDGDGWKVRVFPNKFPICGEHEVVVDSPRHDDDLDSMSTAHVSVLLTVWERRLRHHAGKPYVLLFRNYGFGAGASIMHPHTQVVAMDEIPPVPLKESEKLREGMCPLCGGFTKRVALFGDIVVGVPESPVFPFELWIFPRTHERTFRASEELARALVSSVAVLKRGFNVKSYNLILHQAPRGADYHWHIEVIARLGRFAGFEIGSGVFVLHHTKEEFLKELEKWFEDFKGG